jgi:hypothetical protein
MTAAGRFEFPPSVAQARVLAPTKVGRVIGISTDGAVNLLDGER